MSFFKDTTSALEVICFRFGQILFNLARLFAAHHEKSFVSAFFMVSIDHLFDNLGSGKRNYCFHKGWKKSWILDPKICTNPVITTSLFFSTFEFSLSLCVSAVQIVVEFIAWRVKKLNFGENFSRFRTYGSAELIPLFNCLFPGGSIMLLTVRIG